MKPDVDDFPYPDREEASVPWPPRLCVPGYKKLASWTARRLLLVSCAPAPVSEEAKCPQIQLNYGETSWWTLSKFGRLTATNAEGTGLF